MKVEVTLNASGQLLKFQLEVAVHAPVKNFQNNSRFLWFFSFLRNTNINTKKQRHSLLQRGQDATVKDVVSALCVVPSDISKRPHGLQHSTLPWLLPRLITNLHIPDVPLLQMMFSQCHMGSSPGSLPLSSLFFSFFLRPSRSTFFSFMLFAYRSLALSLCTCLFLVFTCKVTP